MKTKLVLQMLTVCLSATLLGGYVIYAQRRAQPPGPASESAEPNASAEARSERAGASNVAVGVAQGEASANFAPSSKRLINEIASHNRFARAEHEVNAAPPRLTEAIPLNAPARTAPPARGQLPAWSEGAQQPSRTFISSTKSAPVFAPPAQPSAAPATASPAPARPEAATEAVVPANSRLIAPGSKSIDLRLFHQGTGAPQATPGTTAIPIPLPKPASVPAISPAHTMKAPPPGDAPPKAP